MLPPSTAQKSSLRERLPQASAEAIDFMEKCLVFNPAKRMTAEMALAHPYCAQFHNPAEEPVAPKVIKITIDDNTKFSAADYREKLYREIAKRKKESRARGRGGGTGAAAAPAAATAAR